jgi:hypothetical protein
MALVCVFCDTRLIAPHFRHNTREKGVKIYPRRIVVRIEFPHTILPRRDLSPKVSEVLFQDYY